MTFRAAHDVLRVYFQFRGHGPDWLSAAAAGLNAIIGAHCSQV
jgi:hypothetical protein